MSPATLLVPVRAALTVLKSRLRGEVRFTQLRANEYGAFPLTTACVPCPNAATGGLY